MKTLSDFGYNGRAVLDFLIAASPWRSADQAIASLTIFAHPDVVTASGNRAIFRTIRDKIESRGNILNGIMSDDNTSPAIAFEWCTGFKRPLRSDLTCCHLYTASKNPCAYTDIRNIFFAPNFIAKLTDSQATILPFPHTLHALRYRAFDLYGYRGPDSANLPVKPPCYEELEWAEPIGAGVEATELEIRLRQRLAGRPKDPRITRSVAQCGWTFSNYEPDPKVVYMGN